MALQSVFQHATKLEAVTLTCSARRYGYDRRDSTRLLQDYGLDKSTGLLHVTLSGFELEKEANKAIWPLSPRSLTLINDHGNIQTTTAVDSMTASSLSCLSPDLFYGLQRVSLQP